MVLDRQIEATKEQFVHFIKNYPDDKEVVMINTLKFKEKSGIGDESGQAAYMRYSKNVSALVKKAQAKIIWSGEVFSTLIGDGQNHPDWVIIVSYPSKKHFADMTTSEEYQKIKNDRLIALEYGGLWASQTLNK